MKMAIGARAAIVLGATLLAVIPLSSAVAGIHGSSVDGIHGSSVDGIHGSSVDGIHGSSVDGIHGSSVTVLVGVVDGVNFRDRVFESLGQTIMVSAEMLANLSVGDLVTVEGTIAGPGLLYADAVTVSPQQYVAGATEVFVTGVLSSRDLAAGTAMLGQLQVDYTSSLASGDAQNGVVWTFRGTQPSQKGVMLSDRAQAY